MSPDMVLALSVSQVFDSVAVRIDGPNAWDEHLRIAWHCTEEDTTYLIELRNGALHHHTVTAAPDDITTFTLTRLTLIGLVTGTLDITAAIGDGAVTIDGDPTVLSRLVALLAPVDPDFNIVTP